MAIISSVPSAGGMSIGRQPQERPDRRAVVSIGVEGIRPDEICMSLDREFGVMVRSGLHCAPNAHRTIGTFPEGTARLSAGPFTTPDEIDEAAAAVRHVAGESD